MCFCYCRPQLQLERQNKVVSEIHSMACSSSKSCCLTYCVDRDISLSHRCFSVSTHTLCLTGASKEDKLQERLHAVAREITAVKAGLSSLDEAAGDEEAAEPAVDQQQPQDAEPQQAADFALQRAGLTQRLKDLEAIQARLQVCMCSL